MPVIYILTNNKHISFYINQTENLTEQIKLHKSFEIPDFSRKYKLDRLVYTEESNSDLVQKRVRELRDLHKNQLIDLIRQGNGDFKDLSYTLGLNKPH
jgi:putative endonuclease